VEQVAIGRVKAARINYQKAFIAFSWSKAVAVLTKSQYQSQSE
jgi:hypothetical protein